MYIPKCYQLLHTYFTNLSDFPIISLNALIKISSYLPNHHGSINRSIIRSIIIELVICLSRDDSRQKLPQYLRIEQLFIVEVGTFKILRVATLSTTTMAVRHLPYK